MSARTTRNILIVLGTAAMGGILGFLLLRTTPSSSPEERLVARHRGTRLTQTTIIRTPFPQFISELHAKYPAWRVGFDTQTVTLRSPDGRTSLYVSPGYYNPDSVWKDLGSSEQWTTLVVTRPVGVPDFFGADTPSGGEMVVDIPVKYWGRADRHGFALKLETLPSWLSDLYRERTGAKAKR